MGECLYLLALALDSQNPTQGKQVWEMDGWNKRKSIIGIAVIIIFLLLPLSVFLNWFTKFGIQWSELNWSGIRIEEPCDFPQPTAYVLQKGLPVLESDAHAHCKETSSFRWKGNLLRTWLYSSKVSWPNQLVCSRSIIKKLIYSQR